MKKINKINSLTDAQKARFPEWVNKWIEIGLSTKEADWDVFASAIQVAYAKADIPFPERIIRVQSPLVGALASMVAEAILSRGAVSDAVSGAVSGAVRDGRWHPWMGGQFWVGDWWGSPAYVSFFTDVCELQLDRDITERIAANRAICESVNYFWANRKFVMVCNRPEWIRRDDQGRLHSTIGPAIRYRDGWGISCWHGTIIPDAWTRGEFPSSMEMLHWPNIEQRRAGCSLMGWGKILNEIGARIIDKDPNPLIGTLIEADLPDSSKERFLIVECGTGRTGIVLPVAKSAQTAHEANASTWGLSSTQYQPEVRT